MDWPINSLIYSLLDLPVWHVNDKTIVEMIAKLGDERDEFMPFLKVFIEKRHLYM